MQRKHVWLAAQLLHVGDLGFDVFDELRIPTHAHVLESVCSPRLRVTHAVDARKTTLAKRCLDANFNFPDSKYPAQHAIPTGVRIRFSCDCLFDVLDDVLEHDD